MLLEDQLEPLARDIADLLATTDATPGSAWAGYHRNQDLIPDRRTEDDKIVYRRASNHEGMLMFEDIKWRDPDPAKLVFHPVIVLESTRRSSDAIEFPNDTDIEQSFTLNREFSNGESEDAAIQAGFSVENTYKWEAGGEAAQFKVSQEFKTTVSAEWTNQTGTSKDTKVGGEFPIIAPPRTLVSARLEWEEQTQQRRITGFRDVDMKIIIGRRQKYRKYDSRKARKTTRYRWTKGSPRTWDSLDHLIAVIEKRGSPTFQLYDHYARRRVNPVYAERLIANRRNNVDMLTPQFKGAQSIRPVIVDSGSTLDDE